MRVDEVRLTFVVRSSTFASAEISVREVLAGCAEDAALLRSRTTEACPASTFLTLKSFKT